MSKTLVKFITTRASYLEGTLGYVDGYVRDGMTTYAIVIKQNNDIVVAPLADIEAMYGAYTIKKLIEDED